MQSEDLVKLVGVRILVSVLTCLTHGEERRIDCRRAEVIVSRSRATDSHFYSCNKKYKLNFIALTSDKFFYTCP
jgi:hypothetical protein